MKNFPQQRRGKLTSLFGSERRYSRSGSITTTVDKEDDIRNSRIINLPNYKRETLECRLDFVVVFQTIEIERLSLEIESLRVRLLDSERQIFNYKNYEVQIRQLTERCFDYEKEKARYEQELARLNLSLREAEEAYEDARERALAYEEELREREDEVFRFKEELIIERKQREQVEDFRLQLESNLKEKQKAYSRQLRELEKSTQLKRTDLSKNEENLNQLLRKYQEEIKDLRKENANLRGFYDSIQQQSKDLESRYEDLQQELVRTGEALRQKEFELQSLETESRERLQALQARYEEECGEKCRQLEEGENEIAELRGSIDRLQMEVQRLESQISEHEEKKERYQMFLNEAGDEVDRLNTIIKDKNKYLQAWQTRYKELQGKNNTNEQQLGKIQQKLAAYQEEANKMTYVCKTKTEQIEKLERQREIEINQIRDKLAEAQSMRSQLATLRKEKEQEREELKRRQLQNNQLKEQLNRRVAESNKIFQDLHRVETDFKTFKANNAQLEVIVRQKDEDLKRARSNLDNINARCEKLMGERRTMEQELVKMKSLEDRVKHEQAKKNEYLNEGRKLSLKVKELQKANNQKKLSIEMLEKELSKYAEYARQAEERIKQLEGELEFMLEFKKELSVVAERNRTNEGEIARLNSIISQKVQEISALKDKVAQYERFMREFKTQEQKFREEFIIHERLMNQFKQLKINFSDLEDQNMALEGQIIRLQNEKGEALKEVSNLEKIIAINSEELKRVEQHLAEIKQELLSKKDNEKVLFTKIKESEKKIRIIEGQLEKEKGRIAKDRNEIEKQFQKRTKDLQNAIKNEKLEKERIIEGREKLLKQKQATLSMAADKNEELKELLKKNEEQMDKIFKYSKELEKKIVTTEHELERLTSKNQQLTKQLQIAGSSTEKALIKNAEQQAQAREQRERITALIAQEEELTNQIASLKEAVRSKDTDIGHLMEECRQYKQEMTLLYDEVKENTQIHSQQIAQIIKIKFQMENTLELYNGLNIRLAGFEEMISQLKKHMVLVLNNQKTLVNEKSQLESKVISFQEALMKEVERFEELHFKQNQEIIRLETMNKILQIEIGEFKERESVMFSMVKEASIIKEKERESIKVKMINQNKSIIVEKDPSPMKESAIGEINILSKKSRTTRIEEDEFDEEIPIDQRENLRSEAHLKGSKNRIYFENLVFKNI